MRVKGAQHILVTGGAGFIGSHLTERLLSEGHRVTVIDDCSTGSEGNLNELSSRGGLQFIRSKLSDCQGLEDLVKQMDFIFHLAAAVGVELVVRSPLSTMQTNLRETQAILEAASGPRVPTLITSTSEVYGKSTRPAFHEDDDLLIGPPTLGRWSYACSKLMDEFLALAYVRERGVPVIVARLFNTVGPRQTGRYGMVLPRFIAAARSGEALRVHGDGSQTRCFCHVGDTVEALVRLQRCPRAPGQIFNVGSTEEVGILRLAEMVIEILRSDSRIERVPYRDAYQEGFEDMMRRRPRIEKLEEYTGYRPATPLRRTIEIAAPGR